MKKSNNFTIHFLRGLTLIILIIIGLTSSSFAQLTGVKTIPGSYATLAAAITDLNTNGVGAGGVTFNIAAGYTETFASPTAGLITATGTAANPIVFQKSGTGLDPLITAGVGTTTTNDGIIVIAGGDYITFNGIDLQENSLNTTPTQQMEWGYALVKANGIAPFNGCQYITIRNCTITLNKANTASKGIYSGAHTASSVTLLLLTDPSDAMNNGKFYSNTINNCYFGIYIQGYAASSPYNLYDQNNEIGKDGGNIVSTFGGGSVAAYGISTAYQNNAKVYNNSVTGGTGNTTTVYGIFMSTGTSSNVDIVNNTVTVTSSATTSSLAGIYNSMGSTATNNIVNIGLNTVQNCSYPTGTTGGFYGIVNIATPYQVNFYSNTVANNTRAGTSGIMYCTQNSSATILNYYSNNVYNNTNTSTSGTGILYGYLNNGSPVTETYHDNNIYNLTHSGTGTVYGMQLTTAAGVKNSYNNVIHGLSSGGTVYGYNSSYGTPHNFYKNQIYDLTSTAAAGIVYGASFSPVTLNMYNNYIYDLKAPAATSLTAISGIYISGGTNANLYYNTVLLNATTTSATTFGTSGIYKSGATTLGDFRNNIIVNKSAAGPTGGLTVAFRCSTLYSTAYYAATSNNNCFYAGIPSATNLIFNDGTNSAQTIAAYQTLVGRDGLSFSESPNFITIAGNPCRINTAVATQLESGGQPVTTPVNITDDFFANVRNTTTPDVGAEEFTGIIIDIIPPAITYANLGITNLTTARILTATIIDPSGVPTSGTGLPVLYWKKNNGSYNPVTGVSIGNHQYTFTFGSGVSVNDTVRYYIVAQDQSSAPNAGSYPSAGAGGFTINPPAASTPTTAPSFYAIVSGPLAGNYTVGLTLFNKVTGKNITFQKSVKMVMVPVPVTVENKGNNSENDKGTVSTKLVEVEQVSWIPMENGNLYNGPLYIKKSENPGYDYPDGINGIYATITAAVADFNNRGVAGATRHDGEAVDAPVRRIDGGRGGGGRAAGRRREGDRGRGGVAVAAAGSERLVDREVGIQPRQIHGRRGAKMREGATDE